MNDDGGNAVGALEGIRVIDTATLFAGPMAATALADFGADVIKVEHPRGDPARTHGYSKDGFGLWWLMLNRNKKAITLYLGSPEGQEVFKRLIAETDVLIENFRPGTLEKWGLGYEELVKVNPKLILVRVTGFGQKGPYKNRPGFGTLAEAMSGFAFVTGQPDGPPTLPPLALSDGIAGLATAFATMVALKARESTGRGQVIDLAIIEPILAMLGPIATVYDQLGIVQQRTGNRTNKNAPRDVYLTADDKWVAISTSANSIAERVMALVGRSDVISEPWFATGRGRAAHSDELNDAVSAWIRQRTREEVIAEFERVEAAAAPVYDIADVMVDPQYQALDSIIEVMDENLGPVKMQNVLFRMSDTPGRVATTGASLGEHNDEVFTSIGMTKDEVELLRSKEII